MPELIGTTLGPYRILEQIGLGGMATVFKAYQPGMERLVALKILPEHFAAQPKFAQRFEREARIIAKLEHRNILPVYDFGQAGGLTYLVMRYLQAGTVKDILSHGPLPLGDAARVLSDVASALDYAHAQGIVHRDVKPSNILVDKQGSAYLTDFGIAKVLEGTQELTGTSTLGTPAYMAPEQTLGKPVTPQSDVYSLGVMLYEMVTGKAPFESDTPMAVALMHVHEPLPLPRKVKKDLPEAVELVILKALAKEPKDRYASAGDLARAFSAAVGAEGTAAPSRLLELAGVAATGKGSEEVTYDIREEIKKRERTERTRRVMRWAPLTVGGVIAVVLIGVALVYASGQATSAQATMFAAASVTARPTYTPPPTVTPTATPLPTPTAIPFAWARLNSGQFIPRDTITAIAVDPGDPDVIYVGTENAGIYKTIDGGLSWQPVHNGLGRASVQTLAIDRNEPRTVYAGTLLAGVYKTTDGGQTWRAASSGIDLPGWNWTGILVMDRQDSQHLYYTHGMGIYVTTDGGGDWRAAVGSEKTSQLSGCPSAPVGLAINPTNGENIFAAEFGQSLGGMPCRSGIYSSRDGGRTWAASGLQQYIDNFASVYVNPLQANSVYAYLAAEDKLYRSLDGSKTWINVAERRCGGSLAFDPADPRLIYCSDGNGLAVSRDAGSSWIPIDSLRISSGWVSAIAVAPNNSQLVLAGGHELYRTDDGGQSWTRRDSGIGADNLELRLHPTDASTLFVEMPAGQLYRSSDEGRTWTLIEGSASGLEFDSAGTVLYRSWGDSILISRDRGDSWTQLDTPASNLWGLGLSPSGVLYALEQCVENSLLHISTDGGRTWTLRSPYLPCDRPRFAFADSQGKRVYITGDVEIARSDDGGLTWERCEATNYHARYGPRLTVDPQDPDHLFLATRVTGMLESADGCQTWVQRNTGLGSLFVNSVAIDPNNPDAIYAGTDGGAYVSFDGGAHWGPINDGLLGALVVYSIVIDPQSNVYAATPYGIFKLQAAAP